MKKTLTATAIFFAMTVTASATPSGRYLWKGDVFITQVNSACASVGKTVGQMSQVVLEPANTTTNPLPGNGKQDQLMSFPFGELSAVQWVPTSGTYLTKATSISTKGIDYGGYRTGAPKASITVTPQAPTQTTTFVTLSATVTDSTGTCTFTSSGQLMGPF